MNRTASWLFAACVVIAIAGLVAITGLAWAMVTVGAVGVTVTALWLGTPPDSGQPPVPFGPGRRRRRERRVGWLDDNARNTLSRGRSEQ